MSSFLDSFAPSSKQSNSPTNLWEVGTPIKCLPSDSGFMLIYHFKSFVNYFITPVAIDTFDNIHELMLQINSTAPWILLESNLVPTSYHDSYVWPKPGAASIGILLHVIPNNFRYSSACYTNNPIDLPEPCFSEIIVCHRSSGLCGNLHNPLGFV